jgi:hypothetical protein
LNIVGLIFFSGAFFLSFRRRRQDLHLPDDPLCQSIRSRFQIIIGLKPQPEFRRGAEVAAQSEGGVRGDAAFAMDDFVDAPGLDAQITA